MRSKHSNPMRSVTFRSRSINSKNCATVSKRELLYHSNHINETCPLNSCASAQVNEVKVACIVKWYTMTADAGRFIAPHPVAELHLNRTTSQESSFATTLMNALTSALVSLLIRQQGTCCRESACALFATTSHSSQQNPQTHHSYSTTSTPPTEMGDVPSLKRTYSSERSVSPPPVKRKQPSSTTSELTSGTSNVMA